MELAPGGRFVAALPASPTPCPERTGLYVELIGDMNRVLADWCRAGRIGAGTVAAVVVPVWMRTLDEIRAPFEAGGGRIDGLELESAELFRLDNPYWDDDPTVFARGYVRSVTAWGGPLLLHAFAREGLARAPSLVGPSSESSRSASPMCQSAIAGTTSRRSSSPARRKAPSAIGRSHKNWPVACRLRVTVRGRACPGWCSLSVPVSAPGSDRRLYPAMAALPLARWPSM